MMTSRNQTLIKIESENPTTNSVCAVVVTYFPNDGLDDRLSILLSQAQFLVVVDNTPEAKRVRSLKEIYEKDARTIVIENPINIGIAAALNQGLKIALQHNCKWIITLDQDTKPFPHMVQTLIGVSKACGSSAATIGGNYFDSRKGRLRIPELGADEFIDIKGVITSGSLIDAEIAQSIGGFREDYFIDQVDYEFCLRARANGYRIIISRRPVMEHFMGCISTPTLPLIGTTEHSPLRRYYIARNTIVIVMDYWSLEPMWCLRRLVGLLVELASILILQKDRINKIRASVAGGLDGLRRRMGPCRREWLCR